MTCISRGAVKEKYGSDYSESGSDVDDSEDSEDTEEDSDGEELTPAVDAAILRTLALIRKKDSAIYDGGRRVFEGVFDFPWRRVVGLLQGLDIRGGNSVRLYRGTYANARQGARDQVKGEKRGAHDPGTTTSVPHTDMCI